MNLLKCYWFDLFHDHPDFLCLLSIKLRIPLMRFVLPGPSQTLPSAETYPSLTSEVSWEPSLHYGLFTSACGKTLALTDPCCGCLTCPQQQMLLQKLQVT